MRLAAATGNVHVEPRADCRQGCGGRFLKHEAERLAARRVEPRQPAHRPRARRQPLLHGDDPADQDGVSAHARDLPALHRPVRRAGPHRARRSRKRAAAHRQQLRHRALRPVGGAPRQRFPERLPLLVQADAGDGVLPRLRGVAHGAGSVLVPHGTAATSERWILSQGKLQVPAVMLG